MNISFTRKEFLAYTLTPQIMPRARRIVGRGFSHLAFFMALVYRGVNLLPRQHPFTLPQNIGKFGLRQVIATAANNVRLSRHHLDQVVIFFAILAAMIILFIQFILLFIFVTMGSAMAQTDAPSGWGDILNNKNAKTDLALRLLSHIFGVHKLFGVEEQGSAAFHLALQGLFQFYSVALLIVAVLIILYFVFAVVAETAQHGTPFGRRFNHVWAPIRLVVAAGLLIPVGTGGLNAAQYVTLYAAKFGSNFATNGWMTFNKVLGESWKATGEDDKSKLVATPNTPEIQSLAVFMSIVHTCKIANERKYRDDKGTRLIEAFFVKNQAEDTGKKLGGATFENASEYFSGGDIRIRFGEHDRNKYTKEKGNVQPWCGEIVLPNNNNYEPGTKHMQEFYLKLVQDLWDDKLEFKFKPTAENYVRRFTFSETVADDPKVDAKFKKEAYTALRDPLEKAIKEAVEAQAKTESWTNDEQKLKDYGWAGAGVWYNKMAQVNGVLVAAVDAKPSPRLMPFVMEQIREVKKQNNNKIDPESMYRPDLSDAQSLRTSTEEDMHVARALHEIYTDWIKDGGIRADALASHSKLTGNAIVDFINMIFGTSGLFDMCKNADIHPLAQLSNVGKGLVEHSIFAFAASIFAGSGIGSIFGPHVGSALDAVSSMAATIGMIGLVAGFVLFYIIPFLPFLYFFLAVGEWIKGLFEAMVGVPLWALAHLRIDGDGLPGGSALDGYYLILESFLRPIMIIFGLLASLSIFAGMVKVLNEIFYLAVSNLSGFNPERSGGCGKGMSNAEVGSMDWFRGPIDEFFFTIVYAILVYMIGMSCFKLIDLIPDNIMRWLGTGAQSFGKSVGDQAEGLVSTISAGGTTMAPSIRGAAGSLGQAGKGTVQGLAEMLKK